MNPGAHRSVARAIFVVLAFATAVLLSYFSIRNALAVHYASLQTLQGYERATRLEPRDFRNWYLLGRYCQYNLQGVDMARAVQAYTTALALNPRGATIWADLATTQEMEGNVSAARDAFLHAKQAYPLSPEISWRYGNFLLRQGRLDEAFLPMRRAVETDHQFAAEAVSRALRVEPDVGKVLDRILPNASDAYIDVISDQISNGNTDVALAAWNRLAPLHPHLRLQDAYYLTGDLLRRKRFADARRVWDEAVAYAGLGNLQGPPKSILWDGGFESGQSGGSFTWRYPEDFHTVQIGIDPREKHSGNHSLRLTFDGKSNILFNSICHYVVVEPSTNYRFSAWVQTRELLTDEGIRFQLSSPGTQDNSVVVTRDVHGTEPWTQVETSWSSAKDVQEIEVCLLRYPSSQMGHRIRGTAWVDDVALVPEAEEGTKQ